MSLQSPKVHLQEFDRLLRAGAYFEAHEAMENVWIKAGRPSGDLWQGLTQLAVALTHAERGNSRGAARVYAKALAKLEAPARKEPAVDEVVSFAREQYAEFLRAGPLS